MNLGYIGVGFIIAIIASALLNVRNPPEDRSLGGRAPAVLPTSVAILYNYTEASFYGINNMWVMLLLGSLDNAGVCASQAPAVAPAAATVPPKRLLPASRGRYASAPFGPARRGSRAI